MLDKNEISHALWTIKYFADELEDCISWYKKIGLNFKLSSDDYARLLMAKSKLEYIETLNDRD